MQQPAWRRMLAEAALSCRQMTAVLAYAPRWRPKPLPPGYEPDPTTTDSQLLNMMSLEYAAQHGRPRPDREKLFDDLYSRGTGLWLILPTT